MNENEIADLKHWYQQVQRGMPDISSGVPFFVEYVPSVMNRFRHYVAGIGSSEDAITRPVAILLFLSYYMSIGAGRGVEHEVISAKGVGVTKQQVLNVIELTLLACNPFVCEEACERSAPHFKNWDPSEDDESVAEWPAGWSIEEQGANQSGMDFASAELTDADWLQLCGMYRRKGEDMPEYMSLLARHRPDILKAFRHRYEGVQENMRLPKQLLPLFPLHRGAIKGDGRAVRDAALAAKRAGVSKDQLVQTVLWSFLDGTESTMNTTAAALDPILEGWT